MSERRKTVHRKRLLKLAHSVFFRLTAAIVLVAILMTVTILLCFIALRHNMVASAKSNLIRYAGYLAADIGAPPDRSKALAIARDTRIVIRYDSPAQNWTVPENRSIPDINGRFRLWYNQNGISAGSSTKGHFIELSRAEGRLCFWLDRKHGAEQKAGEGFLLLHLLLLLVLTCVYLYIRHVMHPIRWLTTAVDQFSAGNLAYRMPLKRGDEFQDLAESMNNMAAQIQKLIQTKEKLLLDVSHELRSPIARLKVGLELLPETKARSCLQEDLREMETMVTDILETARMQRSPADLNMETVSSAALINAAAQEFSQRPPGIILVDLLDRPLRLDLKKALVVLRNVLDNAFKYGFDSTQPVEITTSSAETLFSIHITDAGSGIAPESLEHVFEPFFRADASRSRQTGGFGLGLSMCKAIMEAHGGAIRIDSQSGRGTRVTLDFPQDA